MGDLSQKLVMPDDAGFESSRDAGFRRSLVNDNMITITTLCGWGTGVNAALGNVWHVICIGTSVI